MRGRRRIAVALAALAVLSVLLLLGGDGGETPLSEEASSQAAIPLASLDPVVEALRAEVWRVKQPGALEDLRRRFDLPFPRSVGRDEEVEANARLAIESLVEVIEREPALAEILGEAVYRSSGLEIWSDTDPKANLRIDLLHPGIKIPPCVAQWPRAPLATALSHELMHDADHRALAAAIGLGQDDLALLLDAILGTEPFRIHIRTVESRAFQVELAVARAVGLRIPEPSERIPVSPDPGCPLRVTVFMYTLSRLQAVERDPVAWDRKIADLMEDNPGFRQGVGTGGRDADPPRRRDGSDGQLRPKGFSRQ